MIGWTVRKYFPQAGRILEVACGRGSVTVELERSFPQGIVIAGDVIPDGFAYARRVLGRVPLLQMDIHHLPFRGDFDVACAFDVLEHLDDDGGGLVALREAVRPGGGVVLTVPQHPSLWSASDDFARHRRRYTRSELRARIEGAGLRVIRLTSFTSMLLPLMALSRWMPRKQYDPVAELRIGSATNAVFSALSAIERAVIAAGVSLPAGGSLLAVAVRPA